MELLLRESDAASRENGDKVKTSGQDRKEGGSRWHLRDEMRPQDLGWLIRSTFSQCSRTAQSKATYGYLRSNSEGDDWTLGSRLVLVVLVCWVSSLID